MPERSRTPDDEKNPHAAALGRLGGLKGGPARAAKLTEEQRSEIARRAARARWGARAESGPAGTGSATESALPGPGAETRYRGLVEQIPAVVYIDAIDEDGTTVYISPQIEDLLGYPYERWRENPGLWFDSVHPDDRDRVFEEYLRRRELGEPWTLEYRMLDRDGEEVWIREDDIVLHDDADRPLAVQGVMFDITEQKLAEERLRDLDRTKNALLHAVSHDLKGPISTVMGSTQMLTSPEFDLGQEDRDKLLTGILNSVRKMDRLVTSLLDLDRLDRGIVEPQRELLDLGALAVRVVAEADVPPDREVEVDVPESPIVVGADPAMVERIVENLVLNAFKHTDARTPVWVRVRREDGGGLILVEDAGIGVPAALRGSIFLPFERGVPGEEGSAVAPGVGIGLSLVARFAELHGGRAWVEEREGGGASFRVFLPAK